MKLKTYLVLALGVSLLTVSCKKGDTGATGAQGTPGQKGDKGDKGDPGTNGQNANVIYSDWMPLNLGVIDHTSDNSSTSSNFTYNQIINTSKLTNDIIDKGQVMLYFKNSQGEVSNINQNNYLYDTAKTVTSTNVVQTFNIVLSLKSIYKGDKITLYVDGYDWWGTGNNSISTLDELIDRFNHNGSKIRYILIPGTTASGRVASGPAAGHTVDELKKMPYKEMAKLLGIK